MAAGVVHEPGHHWVGRGWHIVSVKASGVSGCLDLHVFLESSKLAMVAEVGTVKGRWTQLLEAAAGWTVRAPALGDSASGEDRAVRSGTEGLPALRGEGKDD